MEDSFYSHNDPRFCDPLAPKKDEDAVYLTAPTGITIIRPPKYIGEVYSENMPSVKIMLTKIPSKWFQFWTKFFFGARWVFYDNDKEQKN